MDKPIISKVKLFFGFVFIFSLSVSIFLIFTYYIADYINEREIVKVHFSMFFILCVPLLLYFSFGGFMILMNKESILRKYEFFKKILNVLLGIAALSFLFLIIGQRYMDNELISEGYTKCPKASFRSSTIYVIDAELCKK